MSRETITSDHCSYEQGDIIVVNGAPYSIDGLSSQTELMLKPWPWYKRLWFYIVQWLKRRTTPPGELT